MRRGSTSCLADLKGIQIMNATLNMNSPMGEWFRKSIYDSLNVPSIFRDDSGSAARAAARLFRKKGIMVDYSTLESVRSSTAHLSYAELSELRDAASECGMEESAYQLSIYVQNNPPFRVVELPAATS